jgi:hypothetical protein
METLTAPGVCAGIIKVSEVGVWLQLPEAKGRPFNWIPEIEVEKEPLTVTGVPPIVDTVKVETPEIKFVWMGGWTATGAGREMINVSPKVEEKLMLSVASMETGKVPELSADPVISPAVFIENPGGSTPPLSENLIDGSIPGVATDWW